MRVEYLHIGGTTVIGDAQSRVVPFAVGGVGATRLDPDASTLKQVTRWSLNLGGGVRIPLAQHVRLRFEARGGCDLDGRQSRPVLQWRVHTGAEEQDLLQYVALGGVSVSF